MRRILTLLAVLAFNSAAQAQTYPERTESGLNDFANIVNSITEARINTRLAEYASEHDTEVAVVTLSSLQFYANDSSIEEYSNALFNQWGLGNDETNKGILLLVFRDDREVRLIVGDGYDDTITAQTDLIVSNDILPQFRDSKYSEGIEYGVDGIFDRVINAPEAPTQTADSTPSETGEGSSNTLYYILGAIGAAIAGIIGLNRRNAAKFAAQACTNCGKTGLQKSREVLREPTLEENGAGETRITCPACGHIDVTPYTIPKRTPEKAEAGGTSSGSGSTGKW
jgi:uncharacterized protein